jgi:hypothetical protein
VPRRQPVPPRDPWAKVPVGELEEPLLPRWFVLLALLLVPVALAVFVVAFFAFTPDPDELPPAARRPPPEGPFTHEIGRLEVGPNPPVAYAAPCPELEGVQIAGTDVDQAALRRALAATCTALDDAAVAAAVEAFAGAGGVVRFAAFEATGVDSVVDRAADPPRILVNARFAQAGRPRWISPLIVHDAVMLAGDPATAATALAAREAEAQTCDRVLGGEDRSRGCDDAAAIVALDDPLAALRQAGYR